MSTLRLETNGPIAIVRFDKSRGNAIDEPFVIDLLQACREVGADDTVRGVLLASAHPKLFCPGLDLVGLLDYDRPAMERFMVRFAEAVWALYSLRKPVLASIAGHAVAGGCVLALTADYRVLRRGGVNIGLNEVKVGVPLPWSVSVLLRASVRPERVAEVALLGKNFSDEEALMAGLANELASGEGFEDGCLSRLQEFAEKDPAALAITKGYLRAAAIAEMKSRESELAGEWLDAWFSEATRTRIKAAIVSLTKPKG